MKHKMIVLFTFLAIVILGASVVQADGTDIDLELENEEDYPWLHHEFPMEFKFGNMIDSHQQSMIDGNQILHGFIYIYDTGTITDENILIAEKAHCKTGPCIVGWRIKGVQVQATLMNKSPRIWYVDPDLNPDLILKEPGYSHFHWTGEPKSPHDLEVGETYPGYLLKRVAVRTFFWLGGPGQAGQGSGGCSHDSDGGCSGHDSDTDGGCSGHTSGDASLTDGDMIMMAGPPTEGSMGGGCTDGEHEEDGCTGEDHTDGGCSGDDHTDDGCSGHDGGSGGAGGQGRLVEEGLDHHRNIITSTDEVWQGCGGHD